MAKKTKKKAAGGASKAASMLPDDMSAGLATDFDGTITEVRVVPWDYGGRIAEHALAVRVSIEPDDDEIEPFDQHYSAGSLDDFQPSVDGEEPVDLDSDDEEEWEGYYAVQVGKRTQLSRNSNWAHFIGEALSVGLDPSVVSPDVRFLEGVHGHFDRIAQRKRSGLINEAEESGDSRPREILVLTRVDSEGGSTKSKSKTKSKASKAKAAEAEAEEDEDEEEEANPLDERLEALIVEAIANSDGELDRGALPGLAMKSFKGKERAAAVKRITSDEFLTGSDLFDYDEDEASLSLAEED